MQLVHARLTEPAQPGDRLPIPSRIGLRRTSPSGRKKPMRQPPVGGHPTGLLREQARAPVQAISLVRTTFSDHRRRLKAHQYNHPHKSGISILTALINRRAMGTFSIVSADPHGK